MISLDNQEGLPGNTQALHQAFQKEQPLLFSHIAIKELLHGGKKKRHIPLTVRLSIGHRLQDVIGREDTLHEDRGKKCLGIHVATHGLVSQAKDIKTDRTIHNEYATPLHGQMGHPDMTDLAQGGRIPPQQADPLT